MDWSIWSIWLVAAYLVGAVPFGLLLGKLKGVDIREHGSGNVGATNVGRVLGKKLGLTCFALDVLKGLAPVLAYGLINGCAALLSPEVFHGAGGGQFEGFSTPDGQPLDVNETLIALQWLGIAMATILGHVFPLYLKFKGGKGVATSLGALLGLFPYLTLPALGGFVVWIVTIKLWGYVSLASVAAAAALPILTVVSGILWGLEAGPIVVFTIVTSLLAALVIARHRGNIQRLRQGAEPKAAWAQRR